MIADLTPHMMWLQWVIAGVVALVGIVAGILYLATINAGKHQATATKTQRRETYDALTTESAKLSEFDTPEFLLNAAVDLYERKHSAMATLDDKAQKLIALIGGGASIFALLGGLTGTLHATLTPLLVLAIACFFVALLLLILALRPVETDIPTVTEFNSVPVLASPDYRAKVARRMIEAWQEITLGLTPILRRKGRFIFVSMLLVVAGASLLLANFMVLMQEKPSDLQSRATIVRVSCRGGVQKNRNNISLICEGNTR